MVSLPMTPQEGESRQSYQSALVVGVSVSSGAIGHRCGQCRPCAWNWKPEGCSKGSSCEYCHMCEEGVFEQRVKDRKNKNKGTGAVPARNRQSWSAGAKLHAKGLRRPGAWNWKEAGYHKGVAGEYCPSYDEGTFQRKTKEGMQNTANRGKYSDYVPSTRSTRSNDLAEMCYIRPPPGFTAPGDRRARGSSLPDRASSMENKYSNEHFVGGFATPFSPSRDPRMHMRQQDSGSWKSADYWVAADRCSRFFERPADYDYADYASVAASDLTMYCERDADYDYASERSVFFDGTPEDDFNSPQTSVNSPTLEFRNRLVSNAIPHDFDGEVIALSL